MVVSTAVAHRIPAGWYRDLDDPERRRWWNGVEWTEYYAPVTQPILTIVEPAKEQSDAIGTQPRAMEATPEPTAGLSRRIPVMLLVTLTTVNVVLLTILARTS